MQHGPSGLKGLISGNNHPRRFTATQSQAEPLPADPPSPSRRRGRSEYPVPSQGFHQASMFSSSPSHGCASLTHIPCNKDGNNFLYTRPSLKRTSAPQFQDTPSEVPIVYSRPSKNKCKASDVVHNTKDVSFSCKNFPLYERPSKLHHRPQGVHNTDPVLKSILPKDDRSKKRKEELSTIRSILENQKKLLGHISSAMDCHTSPNQDTYNYRKQNLPKEQTHVPAVETQPASNKVSFPAPPEVFNPPPVVPVAPSSTALIMDKASTDQENETTTQELDNIGQSKKDSEIKDLPHTIEKFLTNLRDLPRQNTLPAKDCYKRPP